MLYFLKEKKKCTGCSACAASCPKHCIKMKQDDEGFWYPEAIGNCIKCGKCERICPSINRPVINLTIEKKAYAARSRDYGIWKRSASGGAFSEICYVWGNESPDVTYCGAAWNKLCVEEKVVQGFSNIEPLCKSKYIASDVGNSFSILKDAVTEGKRVVFCGTPCQIAGFRNYLGKDYDNLLLVDLICHGVGSPLVFQSCIKSIENQFSDEVLKYEFRAKRVTHEQDYITNVTLASGKQQYLKNDQYMQLFLSLNALRPCCVHDCRYKNIYRMGDITIADFKGLIELFPELIGEAMNYSTLVANTEKGRAVCELLKIRMKTMEVSVENIVRYNPLIDHDTNRKNNRDVFFKAYIDDPVSTIDIYTTDAVVADRSVKRIVYDHLPVVLRKKIQGRIRGMNSGKGK